MHVAAERLFISLTIILLKLAFLTVMCYNGAIAVCAAFRECGVKVQPFFIQQLFKAQLSHHNISEWLCVLIRPQSGLLTSLSVCSEEAQHF